MTKTTADREFNPKNQEDLYDIVYLIVVHKSKQGYFKRWQKQALISEGWEQIQGLAKRWDDTKGVSFLTYCWMYLPCRISDGMRGFEEGMKRTKKGKHRFAFKVWQDKNDAWNIQLADTTVEPNSEISIIDEMMALDLTEKETEVLHLIVRGNKFKDVAVALGVSGARISQLIKAMGKKRDKQQKEIINE